LKGEFTVATTGAARARESTLPRSATITIRKQEPIPCGKVEVEPWLGRVHFVNKDKKDYRLRFWKRDTDPFAGIDMLIPAGGRITVLIKKGDEFDYGVVDIGDRVATGKGPGPIVN
jgi:hypothetical protein